MVVRTCLFERLYSDSQVYIAEGPLKITPKASEGVPEEINADTNEPIKLPTSARITYQGQEVQNLYLDKLMSPAVSVLPSAECDGFV